MQSILIQEERLNNQECTHNTNTTFKNKNYASVVSVCNYISSKQIKHLKYTFGACPLEVLEGPLIINLNHLDYPYIKPQYVVCPRNKPIN